MKKLVLLFSLIFVALIFAGCDTSLQFPDEITNYKMELVYDSVEKTVSGDVEVDYINTADTTLNEIQFHLYANAFRDGAKANVVSLANTQKAYYNGKSYGDIKIESAKVDSLDTEFVVSGEDENILIVPLQNELFPDSRIKIEICFKTKLANINHRLGFGENAINICNFYPIACVYENGQFITDLYNANGDPFYSKISNYQVDFVCPKDYVVASSGYQTEVVTNDVKTISINAPAVRDFAIVLSNKFECETAIVNDVELKYYYYEDDSCGENVEIIKKCFSFFSEKIGEYPYKQLSIVKTNFVHGGMEYPNIVLISDDLADNSVYQTVIVHEMCHQWWYGVVGNNQFSYGWIDEGLTEYSVALFFDNFREYDKSSEQIIRSATNSYAIFMRVYNDVLGSVDTSMNRKLNEFNTEPEYVYNTYTKGMLMFSTVKEIIGTEKFYKCLKNYYHDFSFKEVEPDDLIKSFSRSSNKQLNNLFNSWLEGKVVVVEVL